MPSQLTVAWWRQKRRMARRGREKTAMPLHAFARDTVATNQTENSKSKMPQVYAKEIHS
jgi:hypothetical protein